ncbi:MAG: response regulator [candidate division NC10 bacterium]|nr:response regulator [candidate division NC10 bacterium]
MAKILVVDDEALLRAIMQDGLEAAGHEVIVADSGRIALELAKVDRPDCILLDIMMPDMDGYETCAALKTDSDLAPVPVILVSATTDLRVVDRAEQVGAAGVLPKPVPFEQLQHAVSLALDSGSI